MNFEKLVAAIEAITHGGHVVCIFDTGDETGSSVVEVLPGETRAGIEAKLRNFGEPYKRLTIMSMDEYED